MGGGGGAGIYTKCLMYSGVPRFSHSCCHGKHILFFAPRVPAHVNVSEGFLEAGNVGGGFGPLSGT